MIESSAYWPVMLRLHGANGPRYHIVYEMEYGGETRRVPVPEVSHQFGGVPWTGTASGIVRRCGPIRRELSGGCFSYQGHRLFAHRCPRPTPRKSCVISFFLPCPAFLRTLED